MKYNPRIHHRRSVRLKGFDYATPGWYYVTICTHGRQLLFGQILEARMRRSAIGEIACKCWIEIPQHFPNIALDVSIVMPNHLHGIIALSGGTPWRAPTRGHGDFGKSAPGSLATIMGLFKQAVTIRARAAVGARHGVPLQVWQENYYEHVIRNERELNRIREYICNNPLRWPSDPENPASPPDAVDDIQDILGMDDDVEP